MEVTSQLQNLFVVSIYIDLILALLVYGGKLAFYLN